MNELRLLSDDELTLIQPLFKKVFGTPISAELLHWKYAQGRGQSWSLWQKDVLLMHCGLCRREVLLQGERIWAEQLVDLMAAPKLAGLSRGRSPFFILMNHLLAQLGGANNPGHVAFGFPSARAMRLGRLNGVYEAVDQWMELALTKRGMRFGPQVTEITAWGNGEQQVVNSLWLAMRRDLGEFVVGTRDMAYMRHRYLMHPEKRYRYLLVRSRWRRCPIGLFVIAQGQGSVEILDLVCARDDCAESLLAARRWLQTAQITTLKLNLTSHFARELAPFADSCVASGFLIMGNPRMGDDVRQKVVNRWWLTGGDTDYR